MAVARVCAAVTSRLRRPEVASSIGRASSLHWWPSSCGRRASRLRSRGDEPSLSGLRSFDAHPTCDEGRQGSYQVRAPRASMPVIETIRPDPACRAARPSTHRRTVFIVSTSDLPSVEGDLPCVEDDPSSIGRSTFHAWTSEVPRDDECASSSGRTTWQACHVVLRALAVRWSTSRMSAGIVIPGALPCDEGRASSHGSAIFYRWRSTLPRLPDRPSTQ